jgi:hypothetical protein
MALNPPAQPGLATARLDRFLAENHPPTPFVVVDADVVRARCDALRQALPSAEIYTRSRQTPPQRSFPPWRLSAPISIWRARGSSIYAWACIFRSSGSPSVIRSNARALLQERRPLASAFTPLTALRSSRRWPVACLVRVSSAAANLKQGRGMAVDAKIRLRVPYGGRSPGRRAATWAVPGRRVLSCGLATDRSAGRGC